MRLLLFDIDGTLVQINSAGRAALAAALDDLFGTAGPIDSFSMAGKTDRAIVAKLMAAEGFDNSVVERQMAHVFQLMADKGGNIYRDYDITPCPGVPELLEMLRSREEIALGLLTGNASATAPLKLEAAGIDPSLFLAGAYGSDSADRNALPAFAIERVSELTGHSFGGHNTTIIGDTPADVICARAAGATAVAVATGGFSMSDLAAYEPDFLLPDLGDAAAICEMLCSELRVSRRD